ncbi:MAG: Stk1 family PASTA domain-containing Ser/Thr kinase [Eubacteriales bacterium]|nr:Stk1 family PASTA domain-containing Ser/Thr kinase [Eubacteriales bacterium]MDY3332786.1 Stk1 family PASTA domain-containing Ser/Thr kinase [Gallibacter sp.]
MRNSNVLAGRYELIEKIGDGGMAIVYKAKDRLLKRMIALKVLKPEFVNDSKFVENFRRESHSAASLNHPNIVNVYDVGQEGNINYIVMELVDGITLADLIEERGRLEYREVVNLAVQIAKGLQAAHEKDIVHRDIKPQNIMITSEGIAKITDFGIAKPVTNTTIVDVSKENIMGSVHYFSPEQAKGVRVDNKSDIYSLGVVIFEMLTGRVPFDGDNPVTIALMQINEKITPPSAFNPNIPPRLEQIVMKATEKYPSNRFNKIDEMIDALENVDKIGNVAAGAVAANAKTMQFTEPEKNAYDYMGDDYRDYGDDDDDYDYNDKKKKKSGKSKKKIFITIGAIVAVVAIAIAGFFILSPKKDIKVPDFKGMTLEKANEKAEELKISIKVDSYENSDKYKRDEIMSQDPKDGEMVAEGATINVVISKGSEKGVVPNLVGKTEEQAKEMIKQYDFELGRVSEQDSSEPKGTVISQDPSSGNEIKSGETINIVVSNGNGPKEIPNLNGLTESEARKSLEKNDFKLGSVKEAYSSMEYGKVISQSPRANSLGKKGTTVDIVVSKGPDPSSMPDNTGIIPDTENP